LPACPARRDEPAFALTPRVDDREDMALALAECDVAAFSFGFVSDDFKDGALPDRTGAIEVDPVFCGVDFSFRFIPLELHPLQRSTLCTTKDLSLSANEEMNKFVWRTPKGGN
jgi:hypothetical protein